MRNVAPDIAIRAHDWRAKQKDRATGDAKVKLPDWSGETCAVIASGPSVTDKDVETLRAARIKTIVINNSYRIAPWAQIVYFCDSRWWKWQEGIADFNALRARAKNNETLIVTLDNYDLVKENPYMLSFKNTGRHGLEHDQKGLRTGSNSGYQAINLLFHMHAKNILLLGYDMGPVNGKMHWHADHPVRTTPTVFEQLMIPAYKTIVNELRDAGISVFNCSPNSALDVFPKTTLSEVLGND
jgi:hypothetical protein